MQNKIFEQASVNKPKYSAFDLSREQKLTCRFGQLVPTYLEEVLPGDEFLVKTETLVRFAPLIAPIMHRVDMTLHYFFVPNRLVWSEWEDFITGGKNGTLEPVFPTSAADSVYSAAPKLSDYLGLPTVTTGTSTLQISVLPFRAYTKIYNDYYRDENLTDEIDINTTSMSNIGVLRYRSWEKDYFTSALPFLQRGTAVGVPLALEYKDPAELYVTGTSTNAIAPGSISIGINPNLTSGLLDSGTQALRIENLQSLDLAFTINELRQSSALQRWLEKQAIGGYRYIETMLSHFGVKSDDARLQRAEYLGGGKQPIIISEVLNTSATATEPQGNMSGHAVSLGETNSFKYYFKEHGYVMGILSIMPKPAYQQGIHRHWTRNDRFDYYWPELANLGEQPVYNYEIYYDRNDDTYNNGIFGYQQRYAEYKTGFSTVHGEMRSDYDFWHLGRIFSSQPALNQTFVQYPTSSSPEERVFVSNTDDQVIVSMYHDVKARRLMPYFAKPSLR